MFKKIKRAILKVNLKKHPRQVQYPVIDFKMELLVKLKTIFAKDLF